MRMRLNFIVSLVFVAFASACGGSAASSETTADQLKSAPPPVLPLPTDPWAVIPDGSSVLTVDIAAVRASSHAAFLREIAGSLCISTEQSQLFDKTDRVIGAGSAEGGLIALKGRYTDSDLQTLFDRLGAAAKDGAPATEQMHKRIRILKRDQLAAARIGDELIVLGHAPFVEKAAALAEGEKAPLLYDNALFTTGGLRAEIAANTVVLAGLTSEMKVGRLSKSLGAVGLPRDLLEGTMVGALNITASGVDVDVRITKASAQVAADGASAIQRKLGQLGLLARLAGLPPILDRTEARAHEAVLQVKLSATNDDIAVLRGRLSDLLAESPSNCTP